MTKASNNHGTPEVVIQSGEQMHRLTHKAMGCHWQIGICGQEGNYAEQAARAAFAEVDRIEQDISRFIDHSDIARINSLQKGQSLLVGAETAECLLVSQEICRETDGAFDVTYLSKRTAQNAEDASPSEGGKRGPAGLGSSPSHGCGAGLFEVDVKRRMVTAKADGLVVDLGGIGKGFAIDQAVEILKAWSIESAVIHSGQSTVFAMGLQPDGTKWQAGLRSPLDPSVELCPVELQDRALSGSGRRIHGDHIVDPRTAEPARQAQAVWVEGKSACVVDALSTAMMVMDLDDIKAFCSQHRDIVARIFVEEAGSIAHLVQV